MIPLGFPVLALPGAIVLDLVLDHFSGHSDTWNAVVGGTGFLAVNWPFAYFMMSPHARNWFLP